MKIGGGEQGTRDAVARSVLERGPQSAAALAEQLGLSPAAIRRHLDALVADGLLVEREPRPSAQRGRGRPARTYALTDAGRAAFPHAYDDLASTALRYLRDTGGEDAVDGVRRAPRRDPGRAPEARRRRRCAARHSRRGPGPSADRPRLRFDDRPRPASGVQICQHHCPVAHVAAEFPELCEAETRAFEQVLGTYVQRLATIAHGDGVCTTHVPVPPAPSGRH